MNTGWRCGRPFLFRGHPFVGSCQHSRGSILNQCYRFQFAEFRSYQHPLSIGFDQRRNCSGKATGWSYAAEMTLGWQRCSVRYFLKTANAFCFCRENKFDLAFKTHESLVASLCKASSSAVASHIRVSNFVMSSDRNCFRTTNPSRSQLVTAC